MYLVTGEEKIRELLESAYREFHTAFHLERDPIALVHTYRDPRDQEVAGVVSSLLAYGNVTTILSSVRKVLNQLGPSPYERVREGDLTGVLSGFRHRFTTGEDLEILLSWVGAALRSHHSLEAFFVEKTHGSLGMRAKLSQFVKALQTQALPKPLRLAVPRRERQLKYLLSDPDRGSACKRLNLYLRWMVREADGIDLGLWKNVSASELMLPVDTHLLKTLQALRWTQSKTADWKVAESATGKLRHFAPNDPIRFDFALCHLSMEGNQLLKLRTP